jgi:hypothetical protein
VLGTLKMARAVLHWFFQMVPKHLGAPKTAATPFFSALGP